MTSPFCLEARLGLYLWSRPAYSRPFLGVGEFEGTQGGQRNNGTYSYFPELGSGGRHGRGASGSGLFLRVFAPGSRADGGGASDPSEELRPRSYPSPRQASSPEPPPAEA